MSAAATLSDARAKTNIVRLGRTKNGVSVYSWQWLPQFARVAKGAPAFGVLAQELMNYLPGAVTRGDDGLLRVDYSEVLRYG